MRNMVFSQVIMNETMANTFCIMLKLPSSCNILNIDYGRNEFNLLLRLLCVQQNQYDDDEDVVASVVDYEQNIVKLPHLTFQMILFTIYRIEMCLNSNYHSLL
eukprot:606886_1